MAVTVPRGRARSESATSVSSAEVATSVHSTLCKAVQRQRAQTQFLWGNAIPLSYFCLRECTHSPPLSLSTGHTVCGSINIAYALTSCFTYVVHHWSGQHCGCLSSELDTKPDKYRSQHCFSQNFVFKSCTYSLTYPIPRLGHGRRWNKLSN